MALSRGRIFQMAEEYKGKDCKLTFKKVSEKVYLWESTGEWIDVRVVFCDYPKEGTAKIEGRFPGISKAAQKWEVQVNSVYWSRDNGKYFNALDVALKAVELILEKRLIPDLRKDLGYVFP